MSKRLVILCEDTQQEVVIRQWLKCRGINEQILRVQKNPSGRGSGEQYVRKHYPGEGRAYRRQATFSPVGPALITMIDADNHTVMQRLEELDRLLVDSELDRRNNTEQIAILVPKRNIETWIHYMHGVSIDEESVFAKLPNPSECKAAVKGFIVTNLEEPPTDAPDSLALAYVELRRVR